MLKVHDVVGPSMILDAPRREKSPTQNVITKKKPQRDKSPTKCNY